MDKQQLHEILERLHTELQHTRSVDERDREILRALAQDIQVLLDPAAPGQLHQYRSLGGRLAEAVRHFEASHPTLTLTLGQAVDTLAKMGI